MSGVVGTSGFFIERDRTDRAERKDVVVVVGGDDWGESVNLIPDDLKEVRLISYSPG